ncbi:hypothetical protein BDB00DRAFT_236070 [Zychaea mexicana]|uniref:uncharacterized protein n=1 Tax=Zychaea mexicana TaxID=64656 RepID=UPI0022FF43C7|nr:uncharacterized protein BDB00DRAFT_236070 [Zychaea mexicana]KAI9495505.1 hypothetical protein BDB00DRAFT_236070 [Zychaea mexicana]
MPGVMDIQHLLCEPTATEQPLSPTSYSAPPQPQEPVIDRFSAYSAFENDHHSRDYWQQHYYHDKDVHGNSCRSCRSNSISSTNSNSSMPPSPPPMLVRSRTTSDASSQASASPREWAYPATPRDEDSTLFRLGYEPYYLVPQQQQQQQTLSPVSNTTQCYSSNHSSLYPLHVGSGGGGGRYRAPSQGSSSSSASSSSSSRRSRSTSASSVNAPVQTRMAWTPTEDDLLQQGYDEGLSWAMISATYLPHRSRGCCWGRFKTLQSKNLVDPKRQNARLFRRPWKAVDGAKRHHH